MINLSHPVRYEGLCSHLSRLHIPLALLGPDTGQGGQTARNANLCKMVKFTEESAIECTGFCNGFNLLQCKIWVSIVVLICYIFMNTIIVNTAHILIHYCSG